MITYVNTVLVSNDANGAVIAAAPKDSAGGTNYTTNAASSDAGKFIFMNCDPNIQADDIYNVQSGTAGAINTLKVGIVTKKNNTVHMPDGTVKYMPIIKWSNEIKAADIKNLAKLLWSEWSSKPVEDSVAIDFSSCTEIGANKPLSEAGKRIVVRLTYKDMPHRYRKWTESYEYVTVAGNTAAQIATAFATLINKDWKRARVQASAASGVLTLTALPYDDDDNVNSINWANKVRFNANMYWTDPAADGWESTNKHFPAGASITKTPGEQYPAAAKLVRDHESKANGYLGILNHGPGTWPIIQPDMETDLTKNYDALTLEFENMYRAADDIFRKTKQTVEIYTVAGKLTPVLNILTAFHDGIVVPTNIPAE